MHDLIEALRVLAHEMHQDHALREREQEWRKQHCSTVTKFDLDSAKQEILKAIGNGVSSDDVKALDTLAVATEKTTKRLERVARALAALDAKQ